jgi:hypothetical protein
METVGEGFTRTITKSDEIAEQTPLPLIKILTLYSPEEVTLRLSLLEFGMAIPSLNHKYPIPDPLESATKAVN